MKKTSAQLTGTIVPEHYDLFIEPDLKKFIFKGRVEIETKITKPTSQIILNSSELKIKNVSITYNNKTLKPKIKLNVKTETLLLELKERISEGATLSFEFQGHHADTLAGFYRSKYMHNDKEKYLVTTQFEAPYARKAFPCFDQPDKKATFSVSLKIPKDMKAISNMPVLSKKEEEDKKIITFEKTPLMSTYLLYMAVGNFEFIEDKLKNIQIRIITTPGKSQEGKFALDLTKKFLKYFEDYSEVPYPLPKLDLLAIPDFAAGAMENWGAITFREILLLFNPQKTSMRVKKRIAEVIAHELWHQWSGNLVTMEWWNDLWLNESFATYMAYKAVDHYFPEWNMWEDFIDGETTGAFAADALKTTHPIEVKVNSPNEIEEIFDEISYGKGGSVLRMTESYLGEGTFRKGVSNYLKEYQYKNAIAADLWDSLAKISHAPIKEIMESWIKQPGHPILGIKQNASHLALTQQKFSQIALKDKTIWKIPLTIKTETETIKKLMDKKTAQISLNADTKWFKINEDQKGFYRVGYTSSQLVNLKIPIEKKQLSIFDRWGVQNDLFNLTLSSHTSLDKYLDFIDLYKKETSRFVLEDIYSNLSQIYLVFSQEKIWEDIWPKFKTHLKEPFLQSLKKLTWSPKENESQEDALLRAVAISFLTFIEDIETIKTGKNKFQNACKNPDALHPDLKGVTYSLAAKNGDKATYQQLISLYEKAKSPEEKVKLLAALSKFKDKKILEAYLNYSLTNKVRIQDLRTVFGVIPLNPYFKPILFPWVKNNWKKLEELKKTHFVFMALLESLITSYTGKENKKKIKSFLDSKKTGYGKTKANAFETLEVNTTWIHNNLSVLENYFR